MTTSAPERKLICQNRRARRDYFIEETLEVGLELLGSEVKALRDGRANLTDAYAHVRNGELYLLKAHIGAYDQARDNHDPERTRKLLARRGEIQRLQGKLQAKGLTLVPLSLYFKGSWAKAELGLARGKRQYDKRHTIAERENDRRLQRLMKRHTRRGS